MSSLLPYGQCSFRDRHSVARRPAERQHGGARQAGAAGRRARSATGSRSCRRRRTPPARRPRRAPPSISAARRSGGSTLIVLCVPSRRAEGARGRRLLVADRDLEEAAVARGCAPRAGGQSRSVAGRWSGFATRGSRSTASYQRAVLGRRVPGRDGNAAGAQHARELVERALDVEPVEGLPGADDVGARRRQRQRLGGALEDVDVRQLALDHRAQRGVGLDRHERAGERASVRVSLPVPAATSTTSGRSRHVELLERDRERLERPAGPRRLVVLGDRAERERALGSRSHAPRRERVRVPQPLAQRGVVVAHRRRAAAPSGRRAASFS